MLLLDNSAWARLNSPALDDARRAEIAVLARTGELATSVAFLLEAGFSARSAADHATLLADLRTLPFLPVTSEVEELALRAQERLATRGHHRLPPVDLIQAATAAHHRAGVLHYDRGYEILRGIGGLSFESVWLAPRGTLD